MLNKAPSWAVLWGLGNSKLANSTGIWLFVVPIMAKALSSLEGLTFSIGEVDYSVLLALPFRWKMLYFSALFVGLATLFYQICCPKINRYYEDYSSFKSKGKVGRTIVGLFERALLDEAGRKGLQSREVILKSFFTNYTNLDSGDLESGELLGKLRTVTLKGEVEAEAFWYVWHFAENTRPVWRWTVTALYGFGFLLLGIVLFQSVLWVWFA